MAHIEGVSPTAAIAASVRELRKRRGLTAEQLAQRLSAQGIPWDRYTVNKLENGKRQNVTLNEWLALATVLDVAPVHLLVPTWPAPLWAEGSDSRPEDDPNDDAPYQVTPTIAVPCWRARQFVRGARPLPGMDPWKFYAERPGHERPDSEGLRELVQSNERYSGGV